MAKNIPAVGALVRPVGSDLVYRVVEASEHGCRVEAVSTEVVDVPGRAARPLRGSERRKSLACTDAGVLFDDRWRAWERLTAVDDNFVRDHLVIVHVGDKE